MKAKGITPCIPPRKGRLLPANFDKSLYRQRHKIQNMFGKLEDWRRINTRYDRCMSSRFYGQCSSVAIYHVAGAIGLCSERIITNTIEGRLIDWIARPESFAPNLESTGKHLCGIAYALLPIPMGMPNRLLRTGKKVVERPPAGWRTGHADDLLVKAQQSTICYRRAAILGCKPRQVQNKIVYALPKAQ